MKKTIFKRLSQEKVLKLRPMKFNFFKLLNLKPLAEFYLAPFPIF